MTILEIILWGVGTAVVTMAIGLVFRYRNKLPSISPNVGNVSQKHFLIGLAVFAVFVFTLWVLEGTVLDYVLGAGKLYIAAFLITAGIIVTGIVAIMKEPPNTSKKLAKVFLTIVISFAVLYPVFGDRLLVVFQPEKWSLPELNLFGNNRVCPEGSAPQDMYHLRPGTSQEVCLEPGVVYKFFFDTGLSKRAGVRLDELPVRVYHEFMDLLPTEAEELIQVEHHGTPGTRAVLPNEVFVRPVATWYRKHHLAGKPVWFEIYIE